MKPKLANTFALRTFLPAGQSADRSTGTSASQIARGLVVTLVVALLIFCDVAAFASPPQPASPPLQETQAAPKFSNEQLDSLVAPIALYPDPRLSQTLVASTYPLEIMGYADTTGKTAKNRALSERRAKAVIRYLVLTYNMDLRRLIQQVTVE
jgi:hypothetical protein